MSDDAGFAAPPFDATEALPRLKRELRALGLTEREGRFERRGLLIAQAALDEGLLQAAMVRRPSRSGAEWERRTLRNAAELRDFVETLKKKIAAWGDRDE